MFYLVLFFYGLSLCICCDTWNFLNYSFLWLAINFYIHHTNLFFTLERDNINKSEVYTAVNVRHYKQHSVLMSVSIYWLRIHTAFTETIWEGIVTPFLIKFFLTSVCLHLLPLLTQMLNLKVLTIYFHTYD